MRLHRLAVLALSLLLPFAGVITLAGQAKPAAAATKAATPLDLNTATADQLKTLPGIGDAYAKRIVDGRPYTMKNQIVQRGIVPQGTYDTIKDSIVAKRPPAAAKK